MFLKAVHALTVIGIIILTNKNPTCPAHQVLHFRGSQGEIAHPVIHCDSDLPLGFGGITCDFLMPVLEIGKQIVQQDEPSGTDEDEQYCLQTIKDNLRMITPAVLKQINQIVVKFGHEILGKQEAPLSGRCDSVVMETDVHYPTDINLLTDAIRKVIMLCGKGSEEYGMAGWRQYEYNYRPGT